MPALVAGVLTSLLLATGGTKADEIEALAVL
jgi:hypothetical protein